MNNLNKFKLKKIFSIIFFVFIFFDLRSKLNSDINPASNKHLMIVYIHGTVLPIFSFKAFRAVMKNKRGGSFYSRYLNKLRDYSAYRPQPIGRLGLEKIVLDKDIDEKDPNHLIIKAHKKIYRAQKKTYTKYSFYTFGWDGKLSDKGRRKWARKLYLDLISEIQKQKYLNLEIKIMAHSHGGNVALYLHKIEKELKQNLYINSLILLGTPVQSETKFYINSSVFEKIYNFYSKNDAMQVIDVISTKDFFSKRCFKADKKKNFVLPDNLTQIEIKVGKLKPRHCEFWFFGWGKFLLYRKKFPIYPFPVVTFVPLITDLIDSMFKNEKNFKVNINRNKSKNSIRVSARALNKKN